VDYAIWRFYLDGETSASVELQMSQAAFVGNADPSAPWDNEWFGKNSKFGGWHVNVPIPFQHKVRATLQLPEWWNGTERIFAMCRGVEDLPIQVRWQPRGVRPMARAIPQGTDQHDCFPRVDGPVVHRCRSTALCCPRTPSWWPPCATAPHSRHWASTI
jgi:hypothetical protein